MGINPHMPIGQRISEKQKEENELNQLNHDNMIRQQMSSKVGRAFVWHVLGKLGWMQYIVDTNAQVYGRTAKENVAKDVVREIKKVCPNEFMMMEKESEVD